MINKVILVGNVGADPEIRTLENGTKVARVRLATTERIYNRQTQESRDHTEWHTVTLWRNLADVADRFVRKGSQIYIEGRIRSNDWTDNNNIKRHSIEIVADDLKLLGRRPEGGVAPIDGNTYNQAPRDNYGTPQGSYGRPAQPQTGSGMDDIPPVNSADDIDDLPF